MVLRLRLSQRCLHFGCHHFETIGVEQVTEVSFFGRGVLYSEEAVVQTRFGIFPLKYFFSNKRVKVGGSDDDESYINQGEVLKALSALVEGEDKAEPLTDDRLAAMLTAQGFHVARRTVAKYRDLLGIPVAKMRRK